MSAQKALSDKYIEAVKAVYATGQFTYIEIGKIFYISRQTAQRYCEGYRKDKNIT